MKNTILYSILLFSLATQFCIAQCSRTGNFVRNGSDTPTSGSATIIFQAGGAKQVILGTNFSTSNNGPDLHVILCKTAYYNPSTDLIISGVLTKTSGTQTFNVPAEVQLTDFQYILIHCVTYNHRFGYALLGNPSGQNCATLATNSFNEDKENFEIFPNPSTDLIRFSIDQPATVSIYNSVGEKVLSDYKIDDKSTSISLESFSNGLYIVQLDLNGNNYFKKIMKN